MWLVVMRFDFGCFGGFSGLGWFVGGSLVVFLFAVAGAWRCGWDCL